MIKTSDRFLQIAVTMIKCHWKEFCTVQTLGDCNMTSVLTVQTQGKLVMLTQRCTGGVAMEFERNHWCGLTVLAHYCECYSFLGYSVAVKENYLDVLQKV